MELAGTKHELGMAGQKCCRLLMILFDELCLSVLWVSVVRACLSCTLSDATQIVDIQALQELRFAVCVGNHVFVDSGGCDDSGVSMMTSLEGCVVPNIVVNAH